MCLDFLADNSCPRVPQVPVENEGEDVMVVVTVKPEWISGAEASHQAIDDRAAKVPLFLGLLVCCRWKHILIKIQSEGANEVTDQRVKNGFKGGVEFREGHFE